jgi:chromosome condensin MukBEF MukE localization factor
VKRVLWFSLGIAAGALATRKAREAARRLTPAGAAENIGDAIRELAAAVGSFGAEVRDGMLQRQAELNATVAQRTGIELAPGQASTPARRVRSAS